MQQRHKEKVTEARRQHQQLEAEAAIVSAELEALEATVPLADRLAELEQQFQQLGTLEAEIESLIDFESELVVSRAATSTSWQRSQNRSDCSKTPPDAGRSCSARSWNRATRTRSLRNRFGWLARRTACRDCRSRPRWRTKRDSNDSSRRSITRRPDSTSRRTPRFARSPGIASDAWRIRSHSRPWSSSSIAHERCRDVEDSVRAIAVRLAEPPQWCETESLEVLHTSACRNSREGEEFETPCSGHVRHRAAANDRRRRDAGPRSGTARRSRQGVSPT